MQAIRGRISLFLLDGQLERLGLSNWLFFSNMGNHIDLIQVSLRSNLSMSC